MKLEPRGLDPRTEDRLLTYAPGVRPELDYARFSINVRYEDLPALPARLANLSDAEVHRYRRGMREVHRQFIWDEEYGTAYQAVARVLRRRLEEGGDPPRTSSVWPEWAFAPGGADDR